MKFSRLSRLTGIGVQGFFKDTTTVEPAALRLQL